MEKTINLKVSSELNNYQQIMIDKLKKSLISRGCNEIIHNMNHDQDFVINSFETSLQNENDVDHFIKNFINMAHLSEIVIVI